VGRPPQSLLKRTGNRAGSNREKFAKTTLHGCVRDQDVFDSTINGRTPTKFKSFSDPPYDKGQHDENCHEKLLRSETLEQRMRPGDFVLGEEEAADALSPKKRGASSTRRNNYGRPTEVLFLEPIRS